MDFPTLYQIDSKGKVRIWYITVRGDEYRTTSGLQEGKKVTSGWTKAEPTNVGKSNTRDGAAQAISETESEYTKKLEGKYYKTLEEAQTAGTGMKFLQPMLANKYEDYVDRVVFGDAYAQPKLDGIRCTVQKYAIFSRAGKPFVSCPHILEELKSFFDNYPDVPLDGELYNHNLKHDFDKITSLVKQPKPTEEELAESKEKVQFHVYDVVMEGNFAERSKFLRTNVVESQSIKPVETIAVVNQEMLDEYYAKWIADGYEGQMVRLNKPYENKRSRSLLKRKEFMDDEFPLISLEEGLGNWAGTAKRAILKLPDGREFGAGIRGTNEFLTAMLKRFRAGNGPKQATVRFQNYTPDGIPRFGVVTAFYDEERDT